MKDCIKTWKKCIEKCMSAESADGVDVSFHVGGKKIKVVVQTFTYVYGCMFERLSRLLLSSPRD